ncbi:hypothetical protein ACFQDF_25320 [Ectobacillus funiculus]
MSKKKVYTTGILNNQGSPLANDTHIEVFNLGDYSHSVTVEVFNWDTAENGIGPGPTPIPVSRHYFRSRKYSSSSAK